MRPERQGIVVAPKGTLAGNGTLWILLYGGGRQWRAVEIHDDILKGLLSHCLENKCLPLEQRTSLFTVKCS